VAGAVAGRARDHVLGGGPGGVFGRSGNGTGRVFDVRTLDETTADAARDGFGSTAGSCSCDFGGTSSGGLATSGASRSTTTAVAVGTPAHATDVAHPSSPLTRFAPAGLRLVAASAAVDEEAVLPSLVAPLTGDAPARGAHERSAALPQLGPRP
jgi:hypothetical protein